MLVGILLMLMRLHRVPVRIVRGPQVELVLLLVVLVFPRIHLGRRNARRRNSWRRSGTARSARRRSARSSARRCDCGRNGQCRSRRRREIRAQTHDGLCVRVGRGSVFRPRVQSLSTAWDHPRGSTGCRGDRLRFAELTIDDVLLRRCLHVLRVLRRPYKIL